jgi:citronellol/citronellal dehydrogenase
MTNGLRGQVAIGTGASRGLGKAIALGFAREGARVVVAARTEVANPQLPGSIYQTVTEIEALGQIALPVKCDVTDEESVNNMATQVLDRFGRIDVLVNNAGIAFNYPLLETPLKRWDLVLKVNLNGAFLCSKAVLPAMIRQKSGNILNISSLSANERYEGVVPVGIAYAVAKAGLDRFTFGLAAEAGKHNVAVNALKPTKVVDTEGMRFWQAEADKSQWQSPDKMVNCAVFLAQQDARGITGIVATEEELYSWHGLG